MIRNYLKIAFRNLTKYKFISFINVFGLTIGLTCCLLILAFILHELSYDKYQPNKDRVYRVTRSFFNPETGALNLNLSTVAPPFGPLLQNDFKEIEDMTRVLQNGNTALRYDDKMLTEPNVFFADDRFFDFFKVAILKGNPRTALSGPYSVMMTDETAKKYFGDQDPINKIIKINLGNYFDFKVTGIYKRFPSNTHFHPDVMLSFNTLNDTLVYGAENLRTNFGNNSFFTYIRLPKNYNPNKLIAQFPAFLDRRMTGRSQYKPSQGTSLSLQRLTDIHLTSHTDYEAEENGDIKRVYIFSAIALFILLIACINYMNLSTARSTLRAREIGIRKTVGAQRKEIMVQFLSESVLVSWIAMLLAFGLSWILLPWLNKISAQNLDISILLKWQIIIPILLVPFVVGIVSGLYPAIFMSSFQPVKVLKGLLRTGGGNISFRKVLVTLQFAISIILIICTAIVFSQMRYMQNKSLGFDREHIVTLPYASELSDKYDAFRTELLENSNIKSAGHSSRIPTGRLLDAMGSRIMRGDSLAPVTADIKYVVSDQDFISTYGVKVVAGRGFSRDFSTDTSAFLINESAVKVLGFKTNEDAIGKDFGYGNRKGKLIGVFNDFHFESMHQKIVPLVLLVPRNANNYGRISIKISGANIPSALSHIENTWKKFLPETPYQFAFLDENFARLYRAEERQKTLFTTFACLAIFIACLGLFGLSAFAISQRIKEIGIRKVLGANITTIVALLSKDFLRLVVLSAIIAFPVAWYFMSKWLQDFAYRISMPWWVFVIAGIVAALIALITISFQAIKAAVANPVKSLRTE
ncbi:MAG TPA: FtsX-like permease family protein [Chitinophagaceae bacterium]|jgi:putative ABC transport system permease protein|nr:FtsX-like permease family protein [Chitinophagaceae bacterium]